MDSEEEEKSEKKIRAPKTSQVDACFHLAIFITGLKSPQGSK